MENINIRKCCWSKCNKNAICSVTYIDGKGDLNMCEKCYKEYNNHTEAREKMFMEEGIKAIKKQIAKTFKRKLS